jgi:hypothetical protein
MKIINLNPSNIYFTHSRIRQQFTGNGMMVMDSLEECIKNPTQIKSIPKIKVIYDQKSDRYLSMNNRRLWLFKRLQQEGKLESIPVYLEYLKPNSKMWYNTYSLVAKLGKMNSSEKTQ